MAITSGVTEPMLVSSVPCASRIASLRRTGFCVLGWGQTGLIELVILFSLVLSLVDEPITLVMNRDDEHLDYFANSELKCQYARLVAGYQIYQGYVITLWSQISLSELSSICSCDFGLDRSSLSHIELWWLKLVTLCSTEISFRTALTCGWGIMEISENILFWSEGT